MREVRNRVAPRNPLVAGCAKRFPVGLLTALCLLSPALSSVQMDWTQATANAQWSARASHTSVVFDNKMWVLGGLRNDVWYSTNGATWTQATASAGWSVRHNHTSVVFDNKMWVLGGHDASGLRNDVWYSTNGVTWTQATASAGWSARHNHTSVVFDNKMWVLGGWDALVGGAFLNDVWYSTNGVTWTQATANAGWTARRGHASVVFDNRIWLLGGADVSSRKNDVWYSTNGATWTQATANAQWSARWFHASAVFDNKMWVLGGNSLNDVWYSTNGVTWTQATANAGWSARFSHTSVAFDNKIWVLGGYDGGYRNDVWYSSLPPPPAPTPVLPPNGGTVNTLRPTLQVQSISGATQYHFRVYRGGSLAREGYSGSNSWTVDVDLQNGAVHEWDCRAQNAAGWGPYFSPRWSLTVSFLPPAPTPVSPPNGGTVSTLRPSLQVQSISGATQYHFRVYRGGSLVREGDSGSNSWTVDVDLQNGAAHEWDCRAQNAGGWGPYFSPRWSFTISILPSAPTPVAPANGRRVITLRPTLEVQSMSGATQYHFRVYCGGSLVREGYSGSNSWAVDVDLQDGATYEWDSRAQNAAGWGPYFSPRWSFAIRLSLSLAASQYPMFRYNLQHTGRSPYNGSQTSEVRWFYYTTEPVISSPVVAPDTTIYFVSENDTLYALAPSGARRWSYYLGSGGGTQSTPAIAADGTVYVGDGRGNLLALPANLAAPLWSYRTGDSILSSPAICGAIYVGSSDGYLYALNPDGTLRWRNQIGSAIRSSPAVAPDSTIYVGADNQYLYAVNPNGTTRWNIWLTEAVHSSPLIGPDGTVYIGATNGRLWAVTGQGVVKWYFTTGGAITSSPAMDAQGRIYFGSHDRYVYAVEDSGSYAKQVWRYQTGGEVRSSPSVSAQGTVYVGSDDWYVYALRGADGALVWRRLTGNLVRSSPAIGANGIIYIGSNDDRLYAIGSPIGIEEDYAPSSHIPASFVLNPARPNPFATVTGFRFGLAQRGMMSLSIRSSTGAAVRTLATGLREPGWHTAVWDGCDNTGGRVPAGIYFCRLDVGEFTATQKLVLQR